MNLTDLKQVLDERSGGSAEHVMHHVRLHGVRAKVVARRRRRIATWATCAVVALAGIAAAAVVPGLRADVTPTPADSPSPVRTIEGFPEYAWGARVVAAESAALPERRIELTIVPTTLDLVIFTRCAGTGDNVEPDEKVSVNGHFLFGGGCGGSSRQMSWDGLDVAVGKPATFVMTIAGAKRFDGTDLVPVAIPDSGTFGLAIGVRIPFDQYPLPPRPSGPLDPLHQTLMAGCTERLCPDAVIVRSDPADPTRPVQRTLTWKTIDSVDMLSQTPGLLHVRVNGVEIITGEWWDYAMSSSGRFGDRRGAWKREFGLDLKPGDPVTIEIVPEHITGAWQVVFSPA
ncbi:MULTISPECIES: hypothetical protein [Micromonospora]|uniref:Uncharacterized protein n=1 Tax=Micromonospora sicca TaxID=2202420 RepID=A0A317DLI8_9ACTN|nr:MULTISPECIES: hypothetical protein [unclassified Micromonospora]MBM0227028.1 hypothetical protein [Micromonospora sp. ATA51]PWR15639.1 hypothetical protein DKT69_10165 [Micromonospora sp. 4G51]